jgi:hypothetical protein
MNGSGIYVVGTDNNKVLETWPLTLASTNKPIVIDEVKNRVFVGCRKDPMVVVFNSITGEEITSADIKGDLDDISFDISRKRIYAPCGTGHISVVQQIDADNYSCIENVPTRSKARVGVFSQGMDLYFLGVQKVDNMTAPEIWVYQPPEQNTGKLQSVMQMITPRPQQLTQAPGVFELGKDMTI